jgi:hypothetical protein
MDASQMTQPSVEPLHRRPLIAALDEGPLTRRTAVFLLFTAALFAWCWLAYGVASSFLTTVAHGPAPWGVRVFLPSLRIGRLLGDLLLAFAVGAMAATAVRRFKWLVGPVLVMALVLIVGLAWLAIAHRAVPSSPGSHVLVQRRFHIDAMAVLHLAGAIVFAAIGGVSSARILRRVPLSLAASGMLAWVAVVLLEGAFFKAVMSLQDWRWLQHLSDSDSLGRWDLVGNAWGAAHALPYVLVALCFVWAARRDFWTSALIVGGAAVFQILFGRVRTISDNQVRDLLEEAHWAVRGVAAACVGAWLATLVLRLSDPRRLLRDAGIIVILFVVLSRLASAAAEQPSGLHAPRFSPSKAPHHPAIDKPATEPRAPHR